MNSKFGRICTRRSRWLLCAVGLLGALPLAGVQTCRAEATAALAALGKKIFFDPALSSSGRISCATCHSPDHAYGPSDGRAVQQGGAQENMEGGRSVPSLRYVLNRTPIWSVPFTSSEAERLREGDEPPRGGFGWDGRFNTLREQASFPLLAPNEMANPAPEAVVAVLRRTRYAADFRKIFGPRIFDDSSHAYAATLQALERFELEDRSFHPYDSKYDDYLDGKTSLTAQELRGKALFDDPTGGNCASCHPDRKGTDGSHPFFTDFEFEALGVPRNPELSANTNPNYFDAGVCGPVRVDAPAILTRFCGMFKTPSLRNVAIRRAFFHNGRFHTLRDALRFYVRRDTSPKEWYPVSPEGTAMKFDDLPASLRGNVDVIDKPLTLKEGQDPVWSEKDIDDVIAFLVTLTDRDTKPAAP
jgi:cytochrome c peroxidase